MTDGSKPQWRMRRKKIHESAREAGSVPLKHVRDEDLPQHPFWKKEFRKMDESEKRRVESLLISWRLPTANFHGTETLASQYELYQHYQNLDFKDLIDMHLPKEEIDGAGTAVIGQLSKTPLALK